MFEETRLTRRPCGQEESIGSASNIESHSLIHIQQTDIVKDKHNAAGDAYLNWIYDGKPKQGYTFEIMKKTTDAFKLALRFCKRYEQQMKADVCALSFIQLLM